MPALKVSPAQRADLRSQAHALKPVVLIGAEGLTDAVLAEIKVHLAAHELIKIRVFGDEREERVAVYDAICDTLNAAPIQHIGKLLVIWKPEAAPVSKSTGAKSAKGKTALPTAREAAADTGKRGAAPRVVKVVKQSQSETLRRPKAQKVRVLGNERVTAGGTVKRAKKRQTGAKRQHQTAK
ncbi:YhbY family RNA-binding protein [Trinickia dinghuensis]|uniref:RNA-binding protein n=1 Tax=Trinickia dinghuensis TaxID=2291023 RepID=A0A3D8JSB1_9BURK|nr:YhbY family RNA-binding protein [Trinickia dinghuensis]RDU95625.1 RNA-binding protein [Trinickia dinghuensis]